MRQFQDSSVECNTHIVVCQKMNISVVLYLFIVSGNRYDRGQRPQAVHTMSGVPHWFNPFNPNGVKWLHFKVFRAILI